MYRLVKTTMLTLLLCVLAFAGNHGTLKGVVVGETGLPIPDARVIVYNEIKEPIGDALTDHMGVFSLTLQSGKYFFAAESYNYIKTFYPDSYQFHTAQMIELYSNQIKEITISIREGSMICGQITTNNYHATDFSVTAIKVGSPFDGWINTREFRVRRNDSYCMDGLIPGVYKVMVTANNYGTQFYPGVIDREQATTVSVEEGGVVYNIDFNPHQPGSGLISGNVSSLDYSLPLENIKVVAYQQQHPDFDPNKFFTYTDANGNYNLELVSGYYYLCAYINTGSICGDDHFEYYYDSQYSHELAIPVMVNSDEVVTDIDFRVDLNKTYNLEIYGVLNNQSSGLPVPGAKITARDSYTGEPINSAYTQYNGEFIIGNLITGSYFVEISGQGLATSFWPNVLDWQEAQRIRLSSANQIVYNGGAITQDYGTPEFEISGIVKGDDMPLENARVYAIHTHNYSVVHTTTNMDGFYIMSSGLQQGEYLIFADLYGWNGEYYPSGVVLDDIPSLEYIDFNLSSLTTSVDDKMGSEALPSQVGLLGNYPNPFNANTVIMMSFDRSIESKLEIYNLTGQLVNSIPFTAHPGINTIVWNGVAQNGNEVSSGIYLYKVQDLPAVRKMVLVK